MYPPLPVNLWRTASRMVTKATATRDKGRDCQRGKSSNYQCTAYLAHSFEPPSLLRNQSYRVGINSRRSVALQEPDLRVSRHSDHRV